MNIKIISCLLCLLISGGCIIGGGVVKPNPDNSVPEINSSSTPSTDVESSEVSSDVENETESNTSSSSAPSNSESSKPNGSSSNNDQSSKPSQGESSKPSNASSQPESSKPTSSAPASSAPSVSLPESSSPTSSNTSSKPATQSNYRKAVFDLVNEQRAANGLSALKYRDDVQKAADIRAEEIITKFAHTRPNGTSCFTVLKETGVSYRAAGENIAYGQRSPQAVMNAWMNSSGHRANILSSNYTGMAVGYVSRGGVNYWVQLFVK